jgi:hypothetical protein
MRIGTWAIVVAAVGAKRKIGLGVYCMPKEDVVSKVEFEIHVRQSSKTFFLLL